MLHSDGKQDQSGNSALGISEGGTKECNLFSSLFLWWLQNKKIAYVFFSRYCNLSRRTSKLDMYWVKVQNRVSQQVLVCGQFWFFFLAKNVAIFNQIFYFLCFMRVETWIENSAVGTFPFFLKSPSKQIPSKWIPS